MGREWGPKVWKWMAEASSKKVFKDTAERVDKDKKPKTTETVKESRR